MSSKKTDFFHFPEKSALRAIPGRVSTAKNFGHGDPLPSPPERRVREGRSERDDKKRKAGTVRTEGKVPGGQKRFENSQKMSVAGK